MKLVECSERDEIFTHQDPETGEIRRFNSTKMYHYAAARAGVVECLELLLDAKYAEFIRRNRGIESWKLARLKEPYLSRPIIMVELPNGHQLTVDGHHRWVRKHDLGHKVIRTYWFHAGQWEQFLIEDFPRGERETVLSLSD